MGNFKHVFLAISAAFLFSDAALSQSTPLSNQLKDHAAPYLSLHGDDPVAWQDWSQDVMDRAKKENKIVLLSIGYFACHWCHVMQKESFQNDAIAEILNDNFIPVKIDREMEPALDRRLMTFTQQTLGRGGWPLNVFVTPDGYPMYSVLYLPTADFSTVLQRLNGAWFKDQENILKMVRLEAETTFPDAEPKLDANLAESLIRSAVSSVMSRADLTLGGFAGQQKFPSVPQLDFLLSQQQVNPDREVKEFLHTTLEAMANQGMRDQLLGGFFRYTTDTEWAIPHFEKMLYDNASLASLYLNASVVFDQPFYLDIAKSTLDFMRTEMWNEGGALVASFSAVDDESIEGGHYLWTAQEVSQILNTEEYQLVSSVWGLDKASELPAGNQPRIMQTLASYAQGNGLSLDQAKQNLNSATKKLLDQRKQRSLPVDDKLLAAWNGLALKSFSEAARLTDDTVYHTVAEQLAKFLSTELWDGKELRRAKIRGQYFGQASLEDFAYVTSGLLAWSQISNDADVIDLIEEMLHLAWQKFYKNNGWYQQDGTLISPASGEQMISDGAMPSPSAMLIEVSLNVANLLSNEELMNNALSALNRQYEVVRRSSFWHVGQLTALDTGVSQQLQ